MASAVLLFVFFVNTMCSVILILILSCNYVLMFYLKNFYSVFYLASFDGTLQQQKPKAQLDSDSKCRGKERFS